MPGPDSTFDRMSLKQLSELEYILLGDLRDVLEEDSNESNRRWIFALVETLLKTIPREFAIREGEGYMKDLIMACPERDADIQHLRDEHHTLYCQLKTLLNQLGDARAFRSHANILKQEVGEWLDKLQSHNRAEERLVMDVYLQETGGGD